MEQGEGTGVCGKEDGGESQEELAAVGRAGRNIHAYKAEAKKWGRENGVPHMKALEEFAKVCGFPNYHAVRKFFEENPDATS